MIINYDLLKILKK